MDKTTTRMFRVACGMVISVAVIKGVLWARGEFHFNQCVDEHVRRWPLSGKRGAIGNCSSRRYHHRLF